MGRRPEEKEVIAGTTLCIVAPVGSEGLATRSHVHKGHGGTRKIKKRQRKKEKEKKARTEDGPGLGVFLALFTGGRPSESERLSPLVCEVESESHFLFRAWDNRSSMWAVG